jgi:hypothetical protein
MNGKEWQSLPSFARLPIAVRLTTPTVTLIRGDDVDCVHWKQLGIGLADGARLDVNSRVGLWISVEMLCHLQDRSRRRPIAHELHIEIELPHHL